MTRPHVTNSAPVGCVDLVAADYQIRPCYDCYPWYAEVVSDPETGEILVREWHAIECPAFVDLIGAGA